MNNVIIDTSAWIEYFEGTSKGAKVNTWLHKTDTVFLTTGLIIAEILALHLKENRDSEQPVIAVQTQTRLVPFESLLGKETARVYMHHRKNKNKFGLVDAHVAAVARLHNAKILTCDHDFSGLPEAIIIN